MKITALLLTLAIMQVSAATFAQKITLKEKSASLEQVLDQIRQQSGYNFIYRNDALAQSKPVTLNLQKVNLEEALKDCLADQGLEYEIDDKTVIIKIKQPTLIDKAKAFFATVTISGKILDGTNKPIPGATVREKDTQNATVSDAKGAFSLTVPDDKTIIVFSFIGYETLELRAKDIVTGAAIILKASQTNLKEVIINKGYYSEKKALSTSNVSTVTAREIEQQPVSNVLAALEGRVPGLVVTQGTGAPGGSFFVQLRGQSSVDNGNTPFFVVDGVPYPNQTLGLLNGSLQGQNTESSRGTSQGYGNPLNYLNPSDIESIDILKDADATSLYGSRAANGAILITTKKGKAGKMKVNINSYQGIGQVTRFASLLNTQQYLQMRHEAYKNDDVTPSLSDAPDILLWDTTRYTNWQKKLFGNNAHYTDEQMSVSGGNTNTQYLIGAGFHRETSVFPTLLQGTGADKKASVHANIQTTSDDKRFKLMLNASYVSDINGVSPNNLTSVALTLPPDAPALYNPDGSLNWAPVQAGQRGTWSNPFAKLYNTDRAITSNLVSNALLSYTLMPGLEISSTLGYTNLQTDEANLFPTTAYDPGANVASGFSDFNSTNTNSWIIEPKVNFTRNIGEGVFSTLIGATFQDANTSLRVYDGEGFVNDALLGNIGSASTIYSYGSNNTQYKYNAIYARANYNWGDKYVLNLTARRDGSSRFGPGRQFGNFGAIGAAWVFSNENFVKNNLPFISFGKLRGSYGTSGNDQTIDYRYLDLYTTTGTSYQNIQGLLPTNLLSSDLAWEVDRKLELGIELGLLNDRISLEASYYRNRSGNELVSQPLSSVTGFGNIAANLPATVQNKGLEFSLRSMNIKSANFRWSTSFNISANQNKLISFPGLASNNSYKYYYVIGQPLTIRKVFNYAGVNPSTGLYQFKAADGAITSSPISNVDNNILVNTAPKFFGGFGNTFQYKGLTLDFLFQFVKQTGVNLNNTGYLPGMRYNQPVNILNRWQQPGNNSTYEQFSQDYSSAAYGQYSYYAQNSTFIFSDASYIRLKNLSLSYTIPGNWKQKLSVDNVRVYLQGQNLLTITKYLGTDPETQGLSLPPLRVWTIGFQITL